MGHAGQKKGQPGAPMDCVIRYAGTPMGAPPLRVFCARACPERSRRGGIPRKRPTRFLILLLLLLLLLGGAAVYRCDNRRILIAALQIAEKLSFVSGYRFSDTASRLKSDAPSGAGHRNSTFSANSLAAEVTLRPIKMLFPPPVTASAKFASVVPDTAASTSGWRPISALPCTPRGTISAARAPHPRAPWPSG